VLVYRCDLSAHGDVAEAECQDHDAADRDKDYAAVRVSA
jgi:hypothetical protein